MIDFDEKVLKIYELGYRDAKRERDYDPQSHNETRTLQLAIRKLQSRDDIKKKKYNFLIAGLARGGKDTLAEILRDKYGITFQSSSYAAAEIFIYDLMKDVYGYHSVQECFADRHNHRDLWYNLISEYNSVDKAKLAKSILETSDCYVGMRSKEELETCKEQGIFSHILWVDASERVDYKEPESSCTVTKDMADYIIDNNGTLKDLEHMADIVWGIINE